MKLALALVAVISCLGGPIPSIAEAGTPYGWAVVTHEPGDHRAAVVGFAVGAAGLIAVLARMRRS